MWQKHSEKKTGNSSPRTEGRPPVLGAAEFVWRAFSYHCPGYCDILDPVAWLVRGLPRNRCSRDALAVFGVWTWLHSVHSGFPCTLDWLSTLKHQEILSQNPGSQFALVGSGEKHWSQRRAAPLRAAQSPHRTSLSTCFLPDP